MISHGNPHETVDDVEVPPWKPPNEVYYRVGVVSTFRTETRIPRGLRDYDHYSDIPVIISSTK